MVQFRPGPSPFPPPPTATKKKKKKRRPVHLTRHSTNPLHRNHPSLPLPPPASPSPEERTKEGMAPPGQLLPLARSLLPLSAPPFVSGRRRRLPTLVLGRALPPPTWLPHGRLSPAHPLPFAPPRRLSRPPPPATSLPGASPGGGAEAQAVLAEFVTSERVKVAAMLGLALALCNADRVVMSVAIVPLSQAYGWTPSFAGVVQVPPQL